MRRNVNAVDVTRYFTLLVGVAFTAAGIAGFLPVFTLPAPADAPPLSLRRGSASEHLTFGLNLIAGGFLPILGTLWTNSNMPLERLIVFDSGTWAFFAIFLLNEFLYRFTRWTAFTSRLTQQQSSIPTLLWLSCIFSPLMNRPPGLVCALTQNCTRRSILFLPAPFLSLGVNHVS